MLEIQQTSGGGHQNVHTFFQLGNLRVHAHAAKDDGGAQLQVLAVGPDRLLHLGSKFPGGCQHQSTDAGTSEFILRAAAHGEAMQHGQGESGGFAGTGLCAAEQVVAVKHHRDSLGLNRGRRFVTLLTHGFHNGRSQVQFIKVHVEGVHPGR